MALQPCFSTFVVSHCEASHSQTRQLAIFHLFSVPSSGDDDYTDPKAAISIARPRIPKTSRVDARNVLLLCVYLLLVLMHGGCPPASITHKRPDHGQVSVHGKPTFIEGQQP